MKTIYLHIGTPKTGTTHLQQFFAHNRAALLDDGLYYVTDRNGISAQGIAAALGFWEDRDPNAHIERLDWFRSEMRAALDSAADSILVSSEMFCEARVHRRVRLLRRLHAELTSFGEHRIVVICYVRRQDLFIESRQANDIVHWGISPAVKRVDPNLVSYADYYALLSDCRRVFGDDIVVRPYERSQLSNGDLLDDFMDQMGLLVKRGYAQPATADQNTRVRGDLTEMLRLYNLSSLGESREYSFVKAAFLASLFTPAQLAKGPGGRFLVLDPDKRAEILKRYAKSNKLVATEFLKRKDGRLFRDPVAPQPSDASKGPHLLIEEITPLFMHMLMELFVRGEATREEQGRMLARLDGLTTNIEQRLQRADERNNRLEAELHDVRARGAEMQAAIARLQDGEARLLALEARCARLQGAQREAEWQRACQQAGDKKLIGWGTAAAFRKHHFKAPVSLAYVIDNDDRKWGERVKGIPIQDPESLEQEPPHETLVIVYSTAFDAIATQVARLGPYPVVPAEVFARYAPSTLTPAAQPSKKERLRAVQRHTDPSPGAERRGAA